MFESAHLFDGLTLQVVFTHFKEKKASFDTNHQLLWETLQVPKSGN